MHRGENIEKRNSFEAVETRETTPSAGLHSRRASHASANSSNNKRSSTIRESPLENDLKEEVTVTGEATNSGKKNVDIEKKFITKGFGELDEDEDDNDEIDAFGLGLVDKIVPFEEDMSDAPVLTLRSIFIGVCLAIFGGLLAQIYVFKPQPVSVSALFLLVIGYVLGQLFAFLGQSFCKYILRTEDSYIAKIIYPGPFSVKEHAAMVIICSTAAGSALATELIAVSDLFYNKPLVWYNSILLVYSSQLMGYGLAGMFRKVLVYPTIALYPGVLSTVSLYNTLHKSEGSVTKTRLTIFGGIAIFMFFYEWFPQYIAPTLTGVSIFCLLNQQSTPFTRMFGNSIINPGGVGMFTNIFGGVSNNEGFGLFSVCFDWNLITNSCLTYPWVTQINMMIGTAFCIILIPIFYSMNVWQAQDFPFLGQVLFTANGSTYDQTRILNNVTNQLDEAAYEAYGQPYFAMSWAYGLMCNNLGITAAITHICLYNWETIVNAYRSIFTSDFKPEPSRHQIAMERFEEVPQWWYIATLFLSIGVGFYVILATSSGLPWYAYFLAILFSVLLTFVVGFLLGTTGFSVNVQNLVQMLGGLIQPGNPMSNMYFVLYGYNSVNQATAMLTDLKIGQYMRIPPKVVFFCQILGTLIGGVCNYAMTTSIVGNNGPVLLSVQGSVQWSGYLIQTFNSNALTWGALPYKLYGAGSIYFPIALAIPLGLLLPFPFYFLHKAFPKFGFNLINMAVLCWYLAFLVVGVNSSIFSTFAIGFCSQYLWRKYRPASFANYNYIISAGLDAGVQIAVFIINFVVLGAVNPAVVFPAWTLNPDPTNVSPYKYVDYCPKVPPTPSLNTTSNWEL